VAVQTQDSAIELGEHIVQFYEDDAELLEAVSPYLTAAAVAGDVAIVIATEAHRQAFEAALEEDGIDVAEMIASGRLFWLDAASTMAEFITDGEIDHDAFDELIGGLVRTAAESGRPVRAYGEMVALLWDEGDVLGAIELERLWNELARELPFSLFCSYPAASVAGSEHAEALHQVCHLHSSVLHSPAFLEEQVTVEEMAVEMVAEFAAEREAPGHARRLVVAALREWGHDEALVQDAALVLSELATNAVVHAGSPFSVAVRAQESVLRVAVQDASPLDAASSEQGWAPEQGSVTGHGLVARAGHGLGLIDVLATRWGVEASASGKVVWAEIPYAASAGGSQLAGAGSPAGASRLGRT
jgi:anti-sigma regulatory factor (Ser/Thr protein kinase)